ncbi:aldo/keto reductase family protein [Aspergillus vadensis CBS 113365]|uniref:Aldo/keto reductase n=1 Tax=Aspergillus vadensis (strain CBS 113365 / IMI 142717 / IBT 24658) TaxID=1448311 RepID=A0A319BAV8_ASPVC|nr:Aldo/keto reductase [Aspergillus vadensis CBS 113365]PYH67640.1 Aldo/keto reductase [Aspergillus vadensis CBS 113365]
MKVIFGAMNIGEPGDGRTRVHDIDQARRMVDHFKLYGHRDIDTARIYGNGSSEAFLGRMGLSSLALDTKLFPSAANPSMASATTSYHHTPEDLRRGLMESLEALKVSKVHIWYLHSPDRTVPFEETLREVNKLHQEGYFDKLGISNYQAWEVAMICDICDHNGWIKPSVCQGIYNAFHRAVEPELLRCLRYHGISFYCFNPLAAGMLTARYSRDTPDAVSRGRFDPSSASEIHTRRRYYHDVYFDALEILRPVAKQHGLSEVECALRWLSHHSELKEEYGDGVVIGSSSAEQLEENLKALAGGPLPQEIIDALNKGYDIIRGNSLIYWH